MMFKSRVAYDFAEKNRHLGRPDFDCTDHSGLAHSL